MLRYEDLQLVFSSECCLDNELPWYTIDFICAVLRGDRVEALRLWFEDYLCGEQMCLDWICD